MKKIDGYNNQKLAYYNKMRESLRVYSERVSDKSLDLTLRNFMGGESNLRLYIEALQHIDNGFDLSIFDGNFFQQFHVSGLMSLKFVALFPGQLTCKHQIFRSVDSSCVHLLELIYRMIEVPSKRGLVPAGVRLPYGYITTPSVTSSDGTFWADTFPLCDGNCKRKPCKFHPASPQSYMEIGQEMWRRIFDTICSRFFLMFCSDFVGIVAQVCANPAILADYPFSSQNSSNPFVRNPGKEFGMVIPFLPVQIMNASFMSSLMRYFEEFERRDGKNFLLPKPLSLIFKSPIHFVDEGQRKRLNDLGSSGGFLRKLCGNFLKKLSTTKTHSSVFCQVIMTRVLNRPNRAKMHYFVRKTYEFCNSLIRTAQQLNDSAVISLLEQSKGMLHAIKHSTR